LAIDGSIILVDRRHAQNAADTSALAGALAKIQAQESMSELEARVPMRVAALDRAGSNGYANDLLTSTVEVYTCDEVDASCPAPYAGDSDYVQVIISSHVKTFFAGVVGIQQMNNRVQALALADDDDSGPLFDGSAIVALAPTGKGCDGEFIVGGSGTVTIKGGGMFVNSNNTVDNLSSTTCGAFVQDGCKTTLDFIDGGGIVSVGNINLNKNCVTNLEGPMVEGVPQIDFPPDMTLPAPDECGVAGKIKVIDSDTVKIYPGYYDNIPPKAAGKANIVMQPGNYCVDDFKVSSKTEVSGSDVFIYILSGGAFDFSGGVMELDASNADPYRGY